MKVLRINEKTEPGTAMTATVEIGGVVRDLPATNGGEGKYAHVTIHGLAIRYQTGKKLWPGTAIYWRESGHVNNVFGPQDHRQRHHSLQIVGFWEDVAQQYRSEHSSVA
jgi:hypothetical protein